LSLINTVKFTAILLLSLYGCGGPVHQVAADTAREPSLPQHTTPGAKEPNLLKLFGPAYPQGTAPRRCEQAGVSDGAAAADTLYRVLGRYHGARLQVLEACADEAVAGNVITGKARHTFTGAPWLDKSGQGQVERTLPSELAIWLAISDLFRAMKPENPDVVAARGRGTLLNVHRSSMKSYENARGEGGKYHVLRSLLEFRLSPDTTCAAQFKIYGAQEISITPASRVEMRWPGKETEMAIRERYGLLPEEKGQLLWELKRARAKSKMPYTLRIHRSGDFEVPGEQGRVIDQTLICRASRHLLAREINGLSYTIDQVGRSWRAVVQVGAP